MKVNEIFYSLQGEGFYTGVPAVFVRLSGCNLACEFCDTDFRAYQVMADDEILAQVGQYPARHVVLTGGEPGLQVTEAFVDALHAMGCYVQIETNGTCALPANIDWVTCSPKQGPWRIERVDELKVVYCNQDVEAIADWFIDRGVLKTPHRLALQPCSGVNTVETIEYMLAHPRWRLSLQTHKMIDMR